MTRLRDSTERPSRLIHERMIPHALASQIALLLADGMPHDAVRAHAIAEGIPAAITDEYIRAVVNSPLFQLANGARRQVRRYEMVEALRGAVKNSSVNGTAIGGPLETRRVWMPTSKQREMEAEDFFRYYAANTPVVLDGFAEKWKALDWTFEDLAARFGDTNVEVTTGRNADPDYDRRTKLHSKTMKLRDYLAMVESAGATNDFYMVANNRNMDRPELKELLRDIDLDSDILDPNATQGTISLWIGPAGTVTPVHHDNSNIIFVQILGRKVVHLAPPGEPTLLALAKDYYAAIDPSDAPGVSWSTCELHPGQALFIPVGWWHHVRSLEPSINFSCTNFKKPNHFEWYKPGGVS